jgi:hypothetical protein
MTACSGRGGLTAFVVNLAIMEPPLRESNILFVACSHWKNRHSLP